MTGDGGRTGDGVNGGAAGPPEGRVRAEQGRPTGRGVPPEERLPAQDPRVEAFLATLAETPVPRDLASAVVTGVRERPSRRPSWRLPLLAGAAGLLGVVAIAMAAGWRPPIDLLPGPFPSGTPAATSPTAAPSPTPRPPDDFQFLRVAAPGARVYAEPEIGARVLRTLTAEDLGQVVLLRDRRQVGSETWLKVEWDAGEAHGAFVWIPETADGVAPAGVRVQVFERTDWLGCPDPANPDPASLASLGMAERLACFGGASFTFGPVAVDDAAALRPADGDPAWLAGQAPATIDVFDTAGRRLTIAPLRTAPGDALDVPRGRWVRLAGHLDDPAAAGCTRRETDGSMPIGDASDQELWCRQQLVVTGYSADVDPSPTPSPSPSP